MSNEEAVKFTDDDMLILKQTLERSQYSIGRKTVVALVARLEAAEACIKDYGKGGTIAPELIRAWRMTKEILSDD